MVLAAAGGCSGSVAENEATTPVPTTAAKQPSTSLRPGSIIVISCEGDQEFATLRELWESDADRRYCSADLGGYVPTAPETKLAKAFIKSSDWPDDETDALEDMYDACANSDRDAETIFDEELAPKFTSQFAARLCPKAPHVRLLQAVGQGRYFDDGDYAIPNELKPGTYRTGQITITACYWQRTTGGGRMLANALVSDAPQGVTVRIRSTDGGFSSHGCGVWKRVD